MRASNKSQAAQRKRCPNNCTDGTIVEYLETTAYDLRGHKTVKKVPVERICPRCGGSGYVYE
jgi:ribosomal protein S27AE